jgi:hypothetical protein
MVEFEGQKDPAGQRFCADDPAEQYTPAPEHNKGAAAACGQYVPTGQNVQLVIPLTELKVPA